MSTTTRYFRGRAFIVPDSYSDVDDEGGSIQPPIGVLYPLLIGASQGGSPNTVMTFASPQAAANVLRSGPLLDGVKRAFQPFQQNAPESEQSPYLVRCIRLGDGTPLNGPHVSSLVLADSAPGVNEVQTITFPAPLTAGTFALSFGGLTTAPIAFGATAGTIQAALEALSSVGTGNVTVTGDANTTGVLVVTFTGTLGDEDDTTITVDTSSATPNTAATVVETTKGVAVGTPVIKLVSNDYGAYTNSMRVTVDVPAADNTNRFGYKITFARDTSPGLPAQSETFDNIGRYSIDITYLGTGATCLLTVDGTGLRTVVSGINNDNINIPFATYPTLQNVVDQINRNPSYSAEVADVYGLRPANEMDMVTNVDIASPITITYTGTGTATMGVETSSQGNVIVSNTSVANDALSLPLSSITYPTIDALAQAISGDTTGTVAGDITTYTGAAYTVVVKNSVKNLPPENMQLTEMEGFDDGNDVEPDSDDYLNIKSPLAPTFHTAYSTTSNLQAVVDHLNNFYGTLFTATLLAPTALPLATSPIPHFFTGGQDALDNRSGWLKALQLAATADAQVIVPLTPDPYIHNAVKVHCSVMSDPTSRRERVAIVGGAAGESVLDAENRAINLGVLSDGDLIQVVYPGITDVDFNGNLTTIPPYMLAAQMAGMTCALGIGKAKTNKYIKATGVEYRLTRLEVADLIISGVTPIENVEVGFQKGLRVAKDISTWLATPNFIKHLFATKIASQAVSRIVREQCEPLVGLPNDKNFELRVKNRVETTLDNLVRMGVLVDGSNTPAWRNIVIRRDTDSVNIDFEATIVTEVDFIFITAHLDVYRASSTV